MRDDAKHTNCPAVWNTAPGPASVDSPGSLPAKPPRESRIIGGTPVGPAVYALYKATFRIRGLKSLNNLRAKVENKPI